MERSEQLLERLKQEYEPYASFVGSELAAIEALEAELKQAKDPIWLSYREHPITQKQFKMARSLYHNAKMQLANDEGELTSDQRMKIQMSAKWALWFMKSLGGDPGKAIEEVENEIERFARGVGIT